MFRDRENICLDEFIKAYREETCLWQAKSANYHDRAKKDAAYARLVNIWKDVDSNCTKQNVLTKINNIRSSYRKERKKVKQSTKSEAPPDDIYTLKLWYYRLLEFLDEQEKSSRSRSTQQTDDESSESDEVDIITNPQGPGTEIVSSCQHHASSSIVPSSQGTSDGRQIHYKPCPSDKSPPTKDIFLSHQDHFKRPRKIKDRFDLFGKMVVMKIRELRADQRRWAEKFIKNVLFAGEGGNVNGNFSFVPQVSQMCQKFSPDHNIRRNCDANNFASSISNDSNSTSPVL